MLDAAFFDDPPGTTSLCAYRRQVRREATVDELLRGEDGEDWALRYVIAVLRHEVATARRGER